MSLALLSGGCGWNVYRPASVPSSSTFADAALPQGTRVPITLLDPVVTGNGSAASASWAVAHDVRGISGEVVIPAGSSAFVAVRERPHRRIGRPGVLVIEAIGANDRNGGLVRLVGRTEVRGQSRGGRVAGFTIGMAFVYPPLNLLHLLHRGDAAEISPGFTLNAVVAP